ncbi:MAG: hypothetical protein L3J07_04200 [Candidatus Magasanikbacteria bacterium]|nr:hypothetical protein [Candidatus Magasanikbacteria bacterium]
MGALSNKDIAIIGVCCAKRGAIELHQIENFTKAYRIAKQFKFSTSRYKEKNREIENFIIRLAKLIEPEENRQIFRKPKGAEFSTKRAYQHFCWMFLTMIKPEELFNEFRLAWPFCDGNGRVADLIWRMAVKRDTGEWPHHFPPKKE